jgi:TRAP-type C4-dicarboxylate transport system permease small subunit
MAMRVWTLAPANRIRLRKFWQPLFGPLGSIAILFAYLGGAIVAAVGLTSAISIIGRSIVNRPLLGDFELAEMGIFIAGSLLLPYCQLVRGHLAVDFFTLKASPRLIYCFERFGDLLIAVMLLVIAWRTGVAAHGIWRAGETSMLLGVPIWIAYMAAVPGVTIAGLIALAQSVGWMASGIAGNE